MTDDGHLGFDGLPAEQPTAKKHARKRGPAAPVKESLEAPAAAGLEALVENAALVEDRSASTTDPHPAAANEPVPEPTAEPMKGTRRPGPETPTEPEPEAQSAMTAEPAEVEDAVAAAPTPSRLLFLTNRMNLNGILSSRLLAPRESFHKYYTDLLKLTPGWVPILTTPPTAALVERVVAERASGAPVLVELSESVLNGRPPDAPVVCLRAAPLSAVKAIHFRDERSLREHRARGYSNIHPHEDLLHVSPELFTSEPGAEGVIAPPDVKPGTDWLQIDRVRGAVNALLAAADSGEALAVAAGALGAPRLPKDTILPPWLTWDGLTGRTAAQPSESAAEAADRLIFQTAYRVLGGWDQAESWSPSEVYEAVATEIAATRPNDQARAIIDRNLQRVGELVNVERDFEPFRNPGSPYVAAKSFLMVLLRPELEQLLEWPTEETAADETTRGVAAVLAGRLRGIARESVKLRSIVLDDLTAAWAVRIANGEASALGAAEFVADGIRTELLLDSARLRTSDGLVRNPLVRYEALSADARRAARIAVSRRLGWPIEVRVHVPASSDVQHMESVIIITSTESVEVETSVDEKAFIERLRAASGRTRRDINAALE